MFNQEYKFCFEFHRC